MSETSLDELAEDWASVKRLPQQTGLPVVVWITENDGYPHDVRVKVSALHGGHGSWRAAVSMAVRPLPREIVPGSLPAADIALVTRWIELNRDVIIDLWDQAITPDVAIASCKSCRNRRERDRGSLHHRATVCWRRSWQSGISTHAVGAESADDSTRSTLRPQARRSGALTGPVRG